MRFRRTHVFAFMIGVLGGAALRLHAGTLQEVYPFPSGNLDPNTLTLAADGALYGTTASGGDVNLGTVFRFTPGGGLVTLTNFSGANGNKPQAALVQGNDGAFYGTTLVGGSGDFGTICRVTTNG